MIDVQQYIDKEGLNHFERWFENLNDIAAAKVGRAIARMEAGNLSNVKSVGQGVWEFRIDFGPGYRLYFGRNGATLIVLLGGGTKTRQKQDIEKAQALWKEYQSKARIAPDEAQGV